MKLNQSDVKKLGTILGIWAHPDDETFSMGGLIACASANGQQVACVTATKGDAGKTSDPDRWPQERLAKIRTEELNKAMNLLGSVDHYWLKYKDGCLCDCNTNQAVTQLESIIEKVRPDTIITFEPLGITGHSDHKTISEWAKKAAKKKKIKVYGACEGKEKFEDIGRELDEQYDIYFNIDKPFTISKHKADIYLKLPDEILDKKMDALEAQASQTGEMFSSEKSRGQIRQMASEEHFIEI